MLKPGWTLYLLRASCHCKMGIKTLLGRMKWCSSCKAFTSSDDHSYTDSCCFYIQTPESGIELVSSVQFSHWFVSGSLWLLELQLTRSPCSSPTLEFTQTHVHWVGDAIQTSHPSVITFSSCLQSFPAWGSFQMSQLFASGDQSIVVSASTSLLPMNIQDWSPLGWPGLILRSKGFSRVFSNTTVQKHWFFSAHLSL